MKILGIVAEYNPFHNGHKYHIEQAKKIINPDYTVCVMSGNFVQRGEPAIFDKWTRAKFALQNGIDAVFELPVEFSLATAERFAHGAISLLNDIGVNYVAFGSEDSLDDIKNVFNIYLEKENEIKETLDEFDNDFLKTRQNLLGDDSIIKSPNNILAFEYLKAIHNLKSNITPVAIKRFATNHDSDITNSSFASASHIRSLMKDNLSFSDYIPYSLEEATLTTKNDFKDLLNYKLISDGTEKIKEYAEVREGLENRIYKSALLNLTPDELTKEIKSKRYAFSSISRMLFSALIGIEKDNLNSKPLYARLLAANKNGREYLSKTKTKVNIPVITKPSEVYNYDENIIKQAEIDFRATDIYMCVRDNKKTGKADLTTSPVII